MSYRDPMPTWFWVYVGIALLFALGVSIQAAIKGDPYNPARLPRIVWLADPSEPDGR